MIEGARVVERGTPAALEAGAGPFARLFGTREPARTLAP